MPASLVTAVVGLLSGLVGGVFARPLQERLFYHPKLSADFDPGDRRCIADASQRRWARVKIKNSGKVHLAQCQALLTDIQQEQARNDNKWENTDPRFIDPLVLEWAATPEIIRYTPQIIPIEVEVFSNVLFSEQSESGEDKLHLTVHHWPERLWEIFKEHRRYRITVIVTGDRVKRETVRFIVDWKGHWRFETFRWP